MNRKRTGAFLSAAIMTAITLVGSGGTAAADNPLCPTNRFCLFQNANYTGGIYVFDHTINNFSDLRWQNTSGKVDNNASSAINNLNFTAVMWDVSYVPCRGNQYSMLPHSELADFSFIKFQDGKTLNDMASCNYWY